MWMFLVLLFFLSSTEPKSSSEIRRDVSRLLKDRCFYPNELKQTSIFMQTPTCGEQWGNPWMRQNMNKTHRVLSRILSGREKKQHTNTCWFTLWNVLHTAGLIESFSTVLIWMKNTFLTMSQGFNCESSGNSLYWCFPGSLIKVTLSAHHRVNWTVEGKCIKTSVYLCGAVVGSTFMTKEWYSTLCRR